MKAQSGFYLHSRVDIGPPLLMFLWLFLIDRPAPQKGMQVRRGLDQYGLGEGGSGGLLSADFCRFLIH